MIVSSALMCGVVLIMFFLNDTATTEIYTYGHTLSLHDALPIWRPLARRGSTQGCARGAADRRCERKLGRDRYFERGRGARRHRSEEHTSELQSLMRISYAVSCLKKQHPSMPPHKYLSNHNHQKHSNHDRLNTHQTYNHTR